MAYGTPDAATITHTYDLAGNLTASQDPLGRATRFDYDAENRRVRMVHPDDTAKTFAYDALDRMIAETNELGHTPTTPTATPSPSPIPPTAPRSISSARAKPTDN